MISLWRATLPDGCFATTTLTLEVQPAANLGVGNLIFLDANGNGHFDAGEGAPGVVVKLFASGDDPATATPIQTQTTTSEGIYHFESLAPGIYFVHVPASEFQSGEVLFHKVSMSGFGKDAGIDDDVDEDGLDAPSPEITGVSSHDFELVEGTEPTLSDTETGTDAIYDNAQDADVDLTIDLGFIDSPAISVGLGNLVFRDDNNNHVFDEGEGIDGVTVQLFLSTDNPTSATPLRTTVSSFGGRYIFMGLPEGSYKVFIPASQFAHGSQLYGCISLPGAGTDGAGDDNVDEDGIDASTPATTGIVSTTVVLAMGTEPRDSISETGADHVTDNVLDNNTDLTVDLGFVRDCHTITVQPASLPAAQMFAGLNLQLEGTGGVAPYTFVFGYGGLPEGVVLGSNGNIAGIPTTYGSFVFAVQVIDDYGCFALQEYTLVVEPPPLAVGNVVFFDRNGNGVADQGEGVDGVTVKLFTNTQTPGVDAAVATTVTSGGGKYLIDDLAPGNYALYVPAAMFATGAPLWKMKSVSGVVSNGDDDSGEDGQDALNPSVSGVTSTVFSLEPGACPASTAESGLSGSSDDARDANIDLTRDFGFVDSTDVPASFAAWQLLHPGVGGPTANADGDGQGNLMEYALGGDPSTGAQSGPSAFAVTENQANGQMSVSLRRRHGGQGDLAYEVQVLSNLAQSPSGWLATQLTPTTVNNGDGTETLTYGPLESDPALPAGVQLGFVRVAVSLDANHDSTPEASDHSRVFGWQKRTLQVRNQTYSVPFVAREVFSGTVDSVGAANVSVGSSLGSVNINSLFVAGYEYYLEVTSGDAEGQRWEVDEAASNGSTIGLLPANARSTSATLPANLAGDGVALRPHWRVADLFPPAKFHGSTSQTTSDNLLFWDSVNSIYITLWLPSVGTPRWLKLGGGATFFDNMAVLPCDGLFTKPRISTVSNGATGQVRSWKVACPLRTGYNLVGNPYAISQSPVQRLMSVAGGFTGSASQTTSDRILTWTGDATPVSGYDTYYLLKGGSIERWVKQNGGSTDQGSTKVFGANAAAFIISVSGQSNWTMSPTWTP